MTNSHNINNSEISDIAKKLEYQQKLLHAVNYTAQILMAAMDEETFEEE